MIIKPSINKCVKLGFLCLLLNAHVMSAESTASENFAEQDLVFRDLTVAADLNGVSGAPSAWHATTQAPTKRPTKAPTKAPHNPTKRPTRGTHAKCNGNREFIVDSD